MHRRVSNKLSSISQTRLVLGALLVSTVATLGTLNFRSHLRSQHPAEDYALHPGEGHASFIMSGESGFLHQLKFTYPDEGTSTPPSASDQGGSEDSQDDGGDGDGADGDLDQKPCTARTMHCKDARNTAELRAAHYCFMGQEHNLVTSENMLGLPENVFTKQADASSSQANGRRRLTERAALRPDEDGEFSGTGSASASSGIQLHSAEDAGAAVAGIKEHLENALRRNDEDAAQQYGLFQQQFEETLAARHKTEQELVEEEFKELVSMEAPTQALPTIADKVFGRQSDKGAREWKPVTAGDLFVHKENAQRFRRGIPGNERVLEFLPDNATEALKGYEFNSCAIVGSSGILRKTMYGPDIDAHDQVVRLNQAPSGGGCGLYAGARTTMRILNAHWLQKYARSKLSLPTGRRMTYVVTRYDEGDFIRLNERYARKKQERVAVRLLSHQVLQGAQQLLHTFRGRIKRNAGMKGHGGEAVSTGLLTTYLMMHVCRSITLYGFGLVNQDARHTADRMSWYHYFDHMYGKKVMDDTHSFDTERLLLHMLAVGGKLTTCSYKEGGDEGDAWQPTRKSAVGSSKSATLDSVAMAAAVRPSNTTAPARTRATRRSNRTGRDAGAIGIARAGKAGEESGEESADAGITLHTAEPVEETPAPTPTAAPTLVLIEAPSDVHVEVPDDENISLMSAVNSILEDDVQRAGGVEKVEIATSQADLRAKLDAERARLKFEAEHPPPTSAPTAAPSGGRSGRRRSSGHRGSAGAAANGAITLESGSAEASEAAGGGAEGGAGGGGGSEHPAASASTGGAASSAGQQDASTSTGDAASGPSSSGHRSGGGHRSRSRNRAPPATAAAPTPGPVTLTGPDGAVVEIRADA